MSSAERLERLFSAVVPYGGEQSTNEQVAEGVRAGSSGHHGIALAASQLATFRAGDQSTLDADQLAAVAAHFGVDPAYFADDELASAIDTELGYLEKLRDAGWTYDALDQAASTPCSSTADMVKNHPGLFVDLLVTAAADHPIDPYPATPEPQQRRSRSWWPRRRR